MDTYHKIQTIFKRDPETKFKTLLEGEFSLPEFEFLQDNQWVFTEKVDGTNIRIIIGEDGVTFKGKTDAAQIPAPLAGRLRALFDPLVPLMNEKFPKGACLYGEGYGAKIQKGGGNYSASQDFVLFDVKVGPWWLERPGVEDVARDLNIGVVPIIGQGTLSEMVGCVRNGIQSRWGDFPAEGIVARPKTELLTRGGQRIITKLKTRDFQ